MFIKWISRRWAGVGWERPGLCAIWLQSRACSGESGWCVQTIHFLKRLSYCVWAYNLGLEKGLFKYDPFQAPFVSFLLTMITSILHTVRNLYLFLSSSSFFLVLVSDNLGLEKDSLIWFFVHFFFPRTLISIVWSAIFIFFVFFSYWLYHVVFLYVIILLRWVLLQQRSMLLCYWTYICAWTNLWRVCPKIRGSYKGICIKLTEYLFESRFDINIVFLSFCISNVL